MQVDKVYSWMPVKQVWGNQTTIIGMKPGINTVNIQTVGRFEVLSPLPGSKERAQNGYYTGLGSSRTWFTDPTPFDVRNSIPMNADFYANPNGYREVSTDTALSIYPTRFLDRPAYLHLRPTPDRSNLSFKMLWAIADYFLVWCNNAGLYKVRQDGTVTQVNGPVTFTNGPVSPTTIYKWQGTVYSIQQNGSGTVTFYTSTNDGETWQQVSGFNQGLTFSTFHPVGDSLVGITHGLIKNNLYTLRWLSANTLRLRELKTDGLDYADFSDLVPLGDTVYLGMTNGLFRRPLNKFFESR